MTSTERSSTPVHNPVLDHLAIGRRRTLLSVLLDRPSPLDEETLAAHTAARERGTSPEAVPDDTVSTVHLDLVHGHLPALAADDLIEWDRPAATVTTSAHPALGEQLVRRLVRTEGRTLDDLLAGLAHRRRRIVLSALEDTGSASRTALARAIVARESDAGADRGEPDLETVTTDLHHVHLPKLADAELIEYDPDDGSVTYLGHPLLDDEAVASRSLPLLTPS